jgi:hypothetical protein
MFTILSLPAFAAVSMITRRIYYIRSSDIPNPLTGLISRKCIFILA